MTQHVKPFAIYVRNHEAAARAGVDIAGSYKFLRGNAGSIRVQVRLAEHDVGRGAVG